MPWVEYTPDSTARGDMKNRIMQMQGFPGPQHGRFGQALSRLFSGDSIDTAGNIFCVTKIVPVHFVNLIR